MCDTLLLDAPGGGAPKRRIGTLADLLAAHPELAEVLVGATAQEVPKPRTKTRQGQPKPEGRAARKMRYSGKQERHTVKTQVLTTKTCVLHVLGNLPGSVSDLTLLRASGVLRHVPPDLPVRGQRGHTLTALGRAYNRAMGRLRVPVEHMLSRLQTFRVLAQVYRGRWEQHEDTIPPLFLPNLQLPNGDKPPAMLLLALHPWESAPVTTPQT